MVLTFAGAVVGKRIVAKEGIVVVVVVVVVVEGMMRSMIAGHNQAHIAVVADMMMLLVRKDMRSAEEAVVDSIALVTAAGEAGFGKIVVVGGILAERSFVVDIEASDGTLEWRRHHMVAVEVLAEGSCLGPTVVSL